MMLVRVDGFYSFGPWACEADIGAMRNDADARAALARVAALCDSATPGTCREIVHVDLTAPA